MPQTVPRGIPEYRRRKRGIVKEAKKRNKKKKQLINKRERSRTTEKRRMKFKIRKKSRDGKLELLSNSSTVGN